MVFYFLTVFPPSVENILCNFRPYTFFGGRKTKWISPTNNPKILKFQQPYLYQILRRPVKKNFTIPRPLTTSGTGGKKDFLLNPDSATL
jgi:hypothetical protein